MSKYCLTYDAKHSENWNGDELKKTIKELIKQEGGYLLQSPVASTIVFESGKDISFWIQNFNTIKDDIFYYLCLICKDNLAHIEYTYMIDNSMNSRFQEL